MRILMIGQYKPQVEGPANVVINLGAHLSKDNDVTVVTTEIPTYPGQLGHWNDCGVEVWREKLLFPDFFFMSQNLVLKIWRAFRLRNQVDIIHAHSMYDAAVGLLVRSKPLIITYHGLPIQEALNAGWMRPRSPKLMFYQVLEKLVIARADAMIVLNGKIGDWMREEHGVDERRIFMIPNGVDTSKFSSMDKAEARQRIGLDDVSEAIVFVKKLSEQSGVRNLVKSLPRVLQKHPQAVLMLLGDGPLMEEIKALVNELGLAKHVMLMGRVPNENVPAYLSAADVYVLPSVPQGQAEETFGISLLEAMACGKPVIATRIGGPKEILSSRDNVGLLIPPNDIDSLSNSIIMLLDDPGKAREMGVNARRFVESDFTWDMVSKRTNEVYKKIMARGR